MYDASKGIRAIFDQGLSRIAHSFFRSPRHDRIKVLSLPLLLAALASGSAAYGAGPAPVKLGTAGFFEILSKSGITNVPASKVIGNVGTSPITGAADLLTCPQVRGFIFSVDAAGPAPCSIEDPSRLTVAVNDMQAAYTDAAGRVATVTGLGSGNIGGLVIPPGVYKWSSGVIIPTDVTLKGGPNDVWIFQIAQDLTVASATSVLMRGGALPHNVFWQVGGQAVIGTTAHFSGNILSATLIAMQTKASICGRLFAQTAVTLEMNLVRRPR